MTEASGILDTSAFIDLRRLQEASLPRAAYLTTITLAELTVGPLVAESGHARAIRQAHVQRAEARHPILPFDVPTARAFGTVAGSLRRLGRKASARSFDAMIAAIALANDLPVYTCNPDDFAGIDGLRVVTVTRRET
ncbi:MAG: type II toxin-antitoxin system VapC family toxin [Lapillicoccus sp.]